MGILLIVFGVMICVLASPFIKILGVVMIGFGGFILFNPSIYTDAGVDTSEYYDDDE